MTKLHAVRLRPFNRKKGHGMKDYKSAHAGKVYKVGELGQPSPMYIVEDKAELRELRMFPQFEILPFTNRAELEEFLEKETLNANRRGENVTTPKIEHVASTPKATVQQTKMVESLFANNDEDEDEEPHASPSVNHGRQGTAAVDNANSTQSNGIEKDEEDDDDYDADQADGDMDELDCLRFNVTKMEEALNEAITKGRTERTIEKWQDRLADAKEALAKAELDEQSK